MTLSSAGPRWSVQVALMSRPWERRGQWRRASGRPWSRRLISAAEAAAGCALSAEHLTRAVLAVASAISVAGVTEVDVNPVLVRPDGTLRVVDALVVTTGSAVQRDQV